MHQSPSISEKNWYFVVLVQALSVFWQDNQAFKVSCCIHNNSLAQWYTQNLIYVVYEKFSNFTLYNKYFWDSAVLLIMKMRFHAHVSFWSTLLRSLSRVQIGLQLVVASKELGTESSIPVHYLFPGVQNPTRYNRNWLKKSEQQLLTHTQFKQKPLKVCKQG